MKGITITKEIKCQFDERIDFLKKRIEDLNQEFPEIKRLGGQRELFDWKTEKLCHGNELYFRESILKDAKIVD